MGGGGNGRRSKEEEEEVGRRIVSQMSPFQREK